jgi:pseudouridine synthase
MSQTHNKLKADFPTLSHFLAEKTHLSRRDAGDYIKKNGISMNSIRNFNPAYRVTGNEVFDLSEFDITESTEIKTYLVFKEKGVLTLPEKDDKDSLGTVFKEELSGLSPVGRLDKMSCGIILFSNDARITRKLTAEHTIEKEYFVTVRESITPATVLHLQKGVKTIANGVLRAKSVERISQHELSIVLLEGKKHHVRQMCSGCKLSITELERVRIGTLTKAHLKRKKIALLSLKELSFLF